MKNLLKFGRLGVLYIITIRLQQKLAKVFRFEFETTLNMVLQQYPHNSPFLSFLDSNFKALKNQVGLQTFINLDVG